MTTDLEDPVYWPRHRIVAEVLELREREELLRTRIFVLEQRIGTITKEAAALLDDLPPIDKPKGVQ